MFNNELANLFSPKVVDDLRKIATMAESENIKAWTTTLQTSMSNGLTFPHLIVFDVINDCDSDLVCEINPIVWDWMIGITATEDESPYLPRTGGINLYKCLTSSGGEVVSLWD